MVMALAASAVEASAFVPSGVASPSVKSMAPAAAQQVAGKSFDAITTKPATAVALSATGGGAAAKTEDDSGNGALKGGVLLTGGYFALWYLFNIGYNIYKKQALNVLVYPWAIAAIQMATGRLLPPSLWPTGARKKPVLWLIQPQDPLPHRPLPHRHPLTEAVSPSAPVAVSFAHMVKVAARLNPENGARLLISPRRCPPIGRTCR